MADLPAPSSSSVPAPDSFDEQGRKRQTHLAKQDLASLDPALLTPLSPQVISRQATINVGTIGHVAHGKSTIVKSLSGVQTVRFKNELERNITIKLGYANAKIYENTKVGSDVIGRFVSKGSAFYDKFEDEKGTWELRRHISFVDCPGHDILMATMLNGAAVMDAALLLIAGNETCPQPQTSEHLAAVEIMKLQNIIILQNKIDLVKEDMALAQFDQIKQCVFLFVHRPHASRRPISNITGVLSLPTPSDHFTGPTANPGQCVYEWTRVGKTLFPSTRIT